MKAGSNGSAVVTVTGPGDTILTVKDTVNNITQTFSVKVKVRAEGFQMLRHVVTSQTPWFADATFQVRKTYDPADYDADNPWQNQWEWVTDLSREDMTVLESGVPVDMENQELNLRKRDNIPSSYSYSLKTVLLIDNSPSVVANLDLIRTAAKAFAKRALINDPADRSDLGPLLDPNNDANQQEIAVVSYDEAGDTILVQDFSTDLDTVTTAIDSIVRGFGPIDFYDGMIDSLNLWQTDHAPYDAGNDFVQGVVVVMSDGWQSNIGFYDRQAVLDETGAMQIICVSVGDDLVSENSEDLIAFGNAGFYSVPDPGQTVKIKVTPDSGTKSKDVTYTVLERTLMGIQDNAVYPYANSFYWLNYKSALDPAPTCEQAETMAISINNNNNPNAGKNVSGKFESCNFFEGVDGMIYVNQSVTNPDGITDNINLEYVMLGNTPLTDSIFPLEAFTYDDDGIKNTPAYEWAVSNQNIVQVTPVFGSYANSRAVLSLPAVKRPGSASLRIDDIGNSVWKNIFINVSEVQIPGPIAYYPFNGNADDESGNNHDGLVNGPTLTTDRYGNPDSAYVFDGKDDYIALDMFYGPDDGSSSWAAETTDEITVCAWVKSSSTKGQDILSFDRSHYWRFSLRDYIKKKLYNIGWNMTDTNGVLHTLHTNENYADGTWHFVCVVHDADAGESIIYVDGDKVASMDADKPIGSGLGVQRWGMMGSHSVAASFDGLKTDDPSGRNLNFFQGTMDDVMIFHEALSPDDIKLLNQIY